MEDSGRDHRSHGFQGERGGGDQLLTECKEGVSEWGGGEGGGGRGKGGGDTTKFLSLSPSPLQAINNQSLGDY